MAPFDMRQGVPRGFPSPVRDSDPLIEPPGALRASANIVLVSWRHCRPGPRQLVQDYPTDAPLSLICLQSYQPW